MFSKYHYLSYTHNNAANVFICMVNDEIAGFISILPQPCKTKFLKRVHRLVILPDYQGAGFGIKFLEEIGQYYKEQKYRYTIVTSAPSLIYALKKSKNWMCKHYGRLIAKSGIIHGSSNKNNNSKHRITASFEMK